MIRQLAGQSYGSKKELIGKVEDAAREFLGKVPGIAVATFNAQGRQELRVSSSFSGKLVMLGSEKELPNTILAILEGCVAASDL